jgi:hypothetical protein
MIAFGTCNKHFKPLGYPSGRVKSREDLAEMLPTNIIFTKYTCYLIKRSIIITMVQNS